MCLHLCICIADMDNDKIHCPICSEGFSPAVIENHVSKCLFLNESTSKESPSSFKDGSPARKCMKLTSNAQAKKSSLMKKATNLIESPVTNVTDSHCPKLTSSNSNVCIFLSFCKTSNDSVVKTSNSC